MFSTHRHVPSSPVIQVRNADAHVKRRRIRGLAACAGNNLWLNWSAAPVTSLVLGATFLEACLGRGAEILVAFACFL
jgi:hypothetical protein